VGGVTRLADHPFATRRCLTIEPVAHRQSSEYMYATQRRFGLRDAWAGRWTLLEGCHRSSRPPDPHRLVVIVFFAATVLSDTDSLSCGRGRHSFDVRCTFLTRSRCRRAAQQPTLEAHNASGWPNHVLCRVTLLITSARRIVLLQWRLSVVSLSTDMVMNAYVEECPVWKQGCQEEHVQSCSGRHRVFPGATNAFL
jgi:hypothetical protein